MSALPGEIAPQEAVVHPAVVGGAVGQMAAGDAVQVHSDHEALPHPEREELEMHSVLHALSDPMRLRIVAELAARGGEHTCSSIELPIVKSTCTHHFRVLREAGLIRQRVVGTSKVNSLRHEDLEARFPGLLAAVLKDSQ